MVRRAPSTLSKMVLAPLVLLTIVTLSARGSPVNGRDSELDSAVEGVQKYLESSGFPKMTRGEVLEFLDDFSRNSRVSRSDNTAAAAAAAAAGERQVMTVATDHVITTTAHMIDQSSAAGPKDKRTRPMIPDGESPLNYGYPMSVLGGQTASSTTTFTPSPTTTTSPPPTTTTSPPPTTSSPPPSPPTTQMMFVTVPNATWQQLAGGRSAQVQPQSPLKKTVGPSVDLTAYSKFKKIPEARNVKIDDDMAELLSGFGLLDVAGPTGRRPPAAAQRRKDDVAVTETVDEILLKSVLAETGGGANNGTLLDNAAQPSHGHVFNPSDSDVKTVDVNRIAKIVANIRLLADGNDTASLSQDAIQKKLENITADIAAIDDGPVVASTVASAGDGDKDDFDGYQVFFDDESKQAELPDGGGDLPLTPNAAAAALPQHLQTLNNAPMPPDPLSTDELQQLLDKNKNDVKRQEPAVTVADDGPAAQVTEEPAAASTSAEAVRAQPSAADSSSSSEAAAATSTAAVVTQPQSSTEASSPSLSQLAESFGGGETASSIPSTAFETEAPREDRPRNGLYFYVDWNSFLTVNEGQKNQVNLRFAPKAGNPAHFLKVNVP